MSEALDTVLRTEWDRPPRGTEARAKRERGPREEEVTPSPSPHTGQGRKPGWDGPTYYGRGQLKPAPFNNGMVGAYIFVAGLGGSASLISGLAEVAGGERHAGLVRRGRWLATLAPILGAPLLIWDLHTPKRFYNMLRVAKATSPMSIGTWILMVFSVTALPAAAAQWLHDRLPRLRWPLWAARVAHAPAAASGMGLSVYTASLLAATSTPTWAAAPRTLAVRFGASSMASAAAALLLGERDRETRRSLELIAAAALVTEAAATTLHGRELHRKGVGEALRTPAGAVETWVAGGLGVAAPLGLLGVSLALGRRRPRALADLAALAVLAGTLALRISVMAVGDESAARPEISFRFSRPENLPDAG